ncbi:4Fe-4S dicluster domain-containing protein [Rhizobium grahamii]
MASSRQRCVQCKTCDINDPPHNSIWVLPKAVA